MNDINILPNYKGELVHDFWKSYYDFDCGHVLRLAFLCYTTFPFLFFSNRMLYLLKSWQDKLHKLSTYFKYMENIPRIIYTTNSIEGFHRQVRKMTKNKGVFPSDDALLKLIYLAHRNISKT